MVKRLLGICCLLAMVAGMTAQNKVVEKSARRVPSWLNTAVDGCLVVTVTAPTLAQAQEKALTEIGERIVRAVATNITVAQSNREQEVNADGHITSTDDFQRETTLTAAKVPFITGVSLSKAEDIYWQLLRDKKTGAEHYEYSVKYPFTEEEQAKLIASFEKQDKEKMAQYEELERKLEHITRAGDIAQAMAELNALEHYFFDGVRIGQVEALKQRYAQLYQSMTVTGEFTAAGTYTCRVLLSGRPLQTDEAPKVRSDCATVLGVRPADGAYAISFDATDCLPEEENTLDITFFVNGHRLAHKAVIGGASVQDSPAFSVVPEGKIMLTADSVSVTDRRIVNLNIRLTLNNRGGTPFGLKSIELQVPDFSAPIVFDDIDGVYTSKGVIQIKARAEGAFTALETKKSSLDFVQGAVMLVNPQTGAVERIRLSLPYVTNWE